MIEQFFQIGENWIDKEEYLFQLIDAIVFLCFMVCVLYLFVFAVYSKRKSTYKYPTTMKKYRFAALFPAYGEDEVIIDSVKSFLQQDYPRELYDIIVIANQMRQETLDRLKSLSVKMKENGLCTLKVLILKIFSIWKVLTHTELLQKIFMR